MSLDSSKLPHGGLNGDVNRLRPTIVLGQDTTQSAVIKLLNSQNAKEIENTKLYGICLQVLTPEETQRITLANANSYTRTLKTNDKVNSRMKACRVYIPEIHSDRALPNDIYFPSKEDKNKIEFFFPIFMSETEEIAKKSIKAGDIIQVEIKNRLGGGIYTNIKTEGNSSLSIWSTPSASSAKFKCDIIRLKKISNVKGAVVSSGQTIVSSNAGKGVSDDALNQQYIKYLYEKEKAHLADLNAYWKKDKFNMSLVSALSDLDEADSNNNKKKLIWGLIDKVCGYKPVGLAIVVNSTIVNIESLNNDYGIFKFSKEQFDEYILSIERDGGPKSNVEEEIYKSQHSDLLDPDFSIRFFISDFKKYLTKNGLDLAKVSGSGLNDKNKKIIAKYFTANSEKVDSIFTSDFNSTIQAYSPMSGGLQKPSLNKLPTFQEWLSEAVGGVPVDISDFIKNTTGDTNNSQTLDADTPPATPDNCHDNYPHYNDYLVYVDAQKKVMRDYIASPISGKNLNILRNQHKGEKNIIFSGVKINTPFKVIRFDGTTGFRKDSQRWFDINNTKNFIFDKNFIKGYYRPRNNISKIICSSINLKNDSDKYYKNSLNVLNSFNKPFPHFIISTDGQILQLVDIAAAINSNIKSAKTNINICFAEGVGNKLYVTGENNVSLNNYILVKTEKKENAFRPHKIASKASLQAMSELVLFLTNFFNIEYKLAAQPFELLEKEINKSTVQAMGHYKGVSGMDFIYYAWTYGLAYKSGGKNVLSQEYGYN